MENETISLIIIITGIIMSAYFSATETAFSSLNRIRIKNMAEKGDKKACLVMRLSENYDSLLSTILIGNNIVNIASASLTTVLFVKMLGDEIGPSVSTAVTTIVVLIFGEVSPKSIAKESPEKFARFSAPFLNMLMVLLTPFNFLFGQWKKLLSIIIKSTDESGITEEELLSIVEEAKQDGGIDEQENMLIRSVLEFTEQEAVDILTPRIDITAVSTETTKEEIATVFADTAYSRLPIFEDTIDHIVGIIYQKDFYNYVYRADKEISEIIRPALFVPQNKKIGILLKELQNKKIHIAVVLDEYGGTVGIITLEDILEELVGEIWDEYDEVSSEIEKKSETEYIVLGNADIDKVFEVLNIEVADEEVQSGIINGWIMNELGRVPEKEDCFEYKGYQITVLEMNEKRVEKVLFVKKKNE
ncbi:hemolysin family protein [Lachnospiraceae bacterium JLR.KK008]|jgi:Hemolysins and related proteins containing CBS domains